MLYDNRGFEEGQMAPMDRAVQQVLDEYEVRSAAEEKRGHELEWNNFVIERDQFLLAVGPATGQLINLLIKEAESKVILEVGTSYGYSTLWLAEAARETQGRVMTLELHAGKQQYARERMQRAGLADLVDFRLGDATESLANLETPVDFVLLDLWKDLYVPCFKLFHPKLNPGAIVVADNMLFPESSRTHASAYRQHVRSQADMQSMLLPVGSGLEVSRCTRGLSAVEV
jgi:predicted O-methyltransferase YrrM